MAFSINRVSLLGRVAAKPALKYTPNGRGVINIRLATDYSYQKDNEWVRVPQFTTCVFWGRPAEVIDQQVSVGEYLYVEGRLQTRSWEGQDGNKRYMTEVQVQNFVIPRGKREGIKGTEEVEAVEPTQEAEEKAPEEKPKGESSDESVPTDSIPF
mgnify:CR=1 FL=1